MRRFQAILGGVEILLAHRLGADQASVGVIGPLVIGTDEAFGRAAIGIADPEAAMPAGVVMGVDLAGGVTGDDQRILAELKGEEVTGLRNLAVVAGKDPVAVEEVVEVELMERLVAIEGAGEGE